MDRKISFYAAVTLLVLMALAVPVNAWIYHDTPPRPEDEIYELFGPRLDMIFIDMYASEDLMWEALKAGVIDNTDWPLSKTWYAEFTKPEYAGKVRVAYAGGEAGFYTLDFNWNNNTLLGNPPGKGNPPNAPNPVYPNFMHGDDPQVGLAIRRAIALVFNRTKFVDIFLGAMGDLIYTPVPTYMSTYVHPEIRPGGSLETFAYIYNRTKAIEILDNSLFKLDPSTGKRYLDRNRNGNKDPGEDVKIKFYWRSDHLGRKTVGEMLYEEMTTYLKLDVEAHAESAGDLYQHVMLEKNYHMATLGWIFIGPDPDYLYDLYHINNYWHDIESSCPNTAALNDSILNDYAEHIKYANTPDEALEYTMKFQERFAFLAAQVPLYCNVAYKAMSWTYVGDGPGVSGPEDIYEGKNWTHVVNQMGFGVNSWWTFLNAYPYDYPVGNGHMTMRYGWKVKGYPKHLNPLYAEWYWDHEVLNKIYDSLGFRDPYDLGIWRGWLIRGFEPGIWTHPKTGENLTKLTIYLREDVVWSDGTPLTMDDVVFTLVESTKLLIAKGYSPPWYYPNVEHIISYTVLDPYTIELLLDVKSWWAAGWILGGEYIIPKHIWKPIIETGDPAAFQPDTQMIGTGPFKFVSHTPDVSVVLQKNPLTFAAEPVDVGVTTGSIKHKIAPCTTVTFTVSLHNLWRGGNLNVHKKITWVYPNGTEITIVEKDLTLAPCTPDLESITVHVSERGANKIKVYVHILGPDPWTSKEFTFVFPIWATRTEDLNLDFVVDYNDIGPAARAFGSFPGHPRWNALCDLYPDYFIDYMDIGPICRKFGWGL